MKVLVTGGAGFIGSNFAKYLRRHDPMGEVRILDDLSNGRLSNLEGVDVTFTLGSVLDQELVASVAQGVDSIVHLAALGSVPRSVKTPRLTHDANATGTLSVLQSAVALGVEHVVVASSSSVYGSNPKLPKSEDDFTRPLSPYAVSKLATESYALAFGATYGLGALAFRFFNVFGPSQPADHVYAAVIPKFLDAALAGRPIEIHGDGLQSRDFTFVDTVCSTLFSAAQRKYSSSTPLNLAFGNAITILDVVASLEVHLGRSLAREHVEARIGDVRASTADGLRIRQHFPEIVPTSFEAGLAETISWFRKQQ